MWCLQVELRFPCGYVGVALDLVSGSIHEQIEIDRNIAVDEIEHSIVGLTYMFAAEVFARVVGRVFESCESVKHFLHIHPLSGGAEAHPFV